MPRCRERDAALVTYVSLIGRPSVRVYAEALAAEPARKRLGASLRDLLGIEKGVKGLLWFSEKALSLGAEPLRGGCAAGAAVESQAEGSDYEKCVSAGSCRQSEAVRRLAQLPKARPPILILAAHGVEGGAQLLHRVVVEACRLLLTPRRGAACAFVEGFDGCDAESSDVCMLNDGRFSAARYVERGYRLVHLRRDPADVLARSYQLHEPNATHAKNLTLLQEGLEDEWRSLLAGTVYSMQVMADAHRADPRALLLRFEDLAAADTANATLDRLLGFAPRRRRRRRAGGAAARRWRSRLAPRSRRRRMAGACASTCSGWCSASPPSATTSRSCSAPSATRRSSAPRRWARWA